MGDDIANLKTDKSLLDALGKAASHKLTAAEILEQRVSFVYSSVEREGNVTRQHIKQAIQEQEGLAEAE